MRYTLLLVFLFYAFVSFSQNERSIIPSPDAHKRTIALEKNQQKDSSQNQLTDLRLEYKKKDVEIGKQLPVLKRKLEQVISNGEEKEIYDLRIALLRSYVLMDSLDQVIPLSTELIENSKELNNSQRSVLVRYLSFYFKVKELYQEAFYLIPVLKDNLKANEKEGLVLESGYSTDLEIAHIYYNLGDYKKAKLYFNNQALKFKKVGYQLRVASMYNNIGLCFYNMQHYDSALNYYNIALAELAIPNRKNVKTIRKPEYNLFFASVIEANKADIDIEHGLYEKTIPVYQKEITYCIDITRRQIKTDAYTKLSEVFLLLGEVDSAYYYSNVAEESILKSDRTDSYIELYDIKSIVLFAKGELKKGYFYRKKKENLQDSIKAASIKKNALVAIAKYNYKNSQEELFNAQQSIEWVKKLSLFQWIGIGILTILLVVLVILLSKYSISIKTIGQQKGILAKNLKEKEVLLKELHHRVKNNLQVISGILQLQQNKSVEKETNDVLTNAQTKIQSMALTHQLLLQDETSSEIEVQEYLQKLADLILSSGTNNAIETVIYSDLRLTVEKAIPLGLIINELITNSIKHAFNDGEGVIQLKLVEVVKGACVFTYMDNGKGFDNRTTNSKGMTLLHMLTEELNGEIKIQGEKGFSAEITFTK